MVTRRIAEQNEFLHEGDTLTEAFILALEDEERQEICHALNRRTEFKVLRTTYGLFELKPTEKAKIDVEATKETTTEEAKGEATTEATKGEATKEAD